jgi:protein SCO1/2
VGGKSGEAALQKDQDLTTRHTQRQETNATEPQVEQVEFEPFPAPDFLLTDQDGQAFVLSHLRGKVILMDFIFTQCPGPCPMLSTKFSHLQRRLGKRLGKEVMLVSVSIDPQRDTPSALQVYARRYKADLSGWKFLTGTTRAILTVATQYGAEYLGGSEGVRDHRLLTCVINQEGTVVKEFSGVNHTVDELMTVVQELLA